MFSDFFRIDFSGVCSANGGPGGSGVFPAKRGEAHWAGAFFTDAFTNCSLAAGIPHGRFRLNDVMAYPVVRALIYDRDGMIRSVDHYQGGGPAPIYAADGIQPGKQPALWLPFDWGQLRPVSEPALELTEKPYLKDPTRPEADNLDTIFLLRDDMTVLSGDGKLSDANGWWTAWFGRGDRLLTRLRPNAFTLPGYDPPDDALSDSPPVDIDALDMNPWRDDVMEGYPYLYEPLKLTYSPPLGHRVRNDPDNDRRAQVWLSPDYEPQRAPYTLIGQAYSFPLVTGALHTAYADICPLTQDADGNETCLPHPYFSPNAPQAGLPPAERTTPVYTFPAPESPDEEVWLELSATWWDTRTKEEQQAQSGDAGGVEIAHPKGILTSLKPDGDSQLAERLHWRLVTPPNRPDLLETLPATIEPEPFPRLIPHARLNIREPGVYDVELSIVGDEGDRLMLDTMQVQVMGVDLDAHWPGTMAEPGPLVSDAEENDALNLIASVNDDDDNDDDIIDNDRAQSPTILPEDDDVMTFVVRALAVNPGVGTLELFAGDGLHVFTADGMQELTLPLSVDLANPSGPLADAVNAEHPRDVILLVEANLPVERTMVELIYSQNGEEMARDDVHVRVVDLAVQGGYTRGSVRYSAAMNLKGTWVVFRDFDANRPITVLIPEPSHEAGVYRSVWYRQSTDPEQEWKKDGWLLDGSYFFDLVEQWNALLARLHLPFGQYEVDDVLRWMSQATGISQDVLQSGRYLVTGLIDEPGEYDIKLLDTEQNEEHAKEITVHVSRPGQMRGQFRIIGDEEAPYVHEVPLEEIAENDEQFFRTLGGMRLHLSAEFAPLLTQYEAEIVGFEWYSTQEIAFHFSAASFAEGQPNNLRADLVSQGVPEAVIVALQGVLENKSFHNLDALLDVIPPAFKGYTINDRALNELNKYVEEGLFPDYFENSKNKQNPRDGLRALRWEKKDGELMEVKERSYANAESLAEALRTTKNVDDASRYAVAGYRVSRQVLARSRATHDSSSYEPADQLAWKIPYDIYLKIEQSSALRGGEGGPGRSYRIVKNDEFQDFKHALHHAVGSAAYDEIVMRYAAHLRLFTPTIKLLTSNGNYYTLCRDLLVKHGRVHTGQLYPDYRTTLDHFMISKEILEHLKEAGLSDEMLTVLKEKLLNQIFLTEEEFLNTLKQADMLGEEATITHQAALVRWAKTAPPLPDDELQRRKTLASDALELRKEIYWQGEARPDLNELIHLSLTFGKRMRDDQVEVLGTVPITRRIKSRVLQLADPLMEGNDVMMLQEVLRQLGQSQSAGAGYQGDAVAITNSFSENTNKALNRLRYQDELANKEDVDNNTPTSTSPGVLLKIGEHREDYLRAFEAYPDTPHARENVPSEAVFETWVEHGAHELAKTYTNKFVAEVGGFQEDDADSCDEDRKNLIRAWVTKEASKGHWGFLPIWNDRFSYRIVLGGADEMGSIGFSQIQSQYKYGSNQVATRTFQEINLYDPADAIRGFALFSNSPDLGNGFNRAFVETGDTSYQKNHDYANNNEYPRVGEQYKDDGKDRLSKGVMAYNAGQGLAHADVRNTIWPETLRKFAPPEYPGPGIEDICQQNLIAPTIRARCGINYTLNIQAHAQVPLKTWIWTAQRFVNGDENWTCTFDAAQITAWHDELLCNPGTVALPGQILIVPGEDGILNTLAHLDDPAMTEEQRQHLVVERFQFTFSEEEWRYNRTENPVKEGISWGEKVAQEDHVAENRIP